MNCKLNLVYVADFVDSVCGLIHFQRINVFFSQKKKHTFSLQVKNSNVNHLNHFLRLFLSNINCSILSNKRKLQLIF